jgi:hypothetical protein
VTSAAETAQTTTAILESGAIMLGAALVFVTLFRRLKLGATLGYIVAGALIGPQLLRLIRDPQQLTSVTEIGIALLLFIVGLELQPSRLWRLRKDIFGLGLAQVVMPGVMSRVVGIDHEDDRNRTVMRLMGMREISHGVAILSNQQPKKAVWARVAGDALDLALLGLVAVRNRRARTAFAVANVLAVAVPDVAESLRLAREHGDAAKGKLVRKAVTLNASRAEVEAAFAAAPPGTLETATDLDKGHGRLEQRVVSLIREVDWLTGERHFPGELRLPEPACLIRVEATVERGRAAREPQTETLLHRLGQALRRQGRPGHPRPLGH